LFVDRFSPGTLNMADGGAMPRSVRRSHRRARTPCSSWWRQRCPNVAYTRNGHRRTARTRGTGRSANLAGGPPNLW